MAFIINNDQVITDLTEGKLSELYVDNTSVLVGDGLGNVSLRNVFLDIANIDTSALTTDNISEGSNLFYTDTRVAHYLTVNAYATDAYVDSVAQGLQLNINAEQFAREIIDATLQDQINTLIVTSTGDIATVQSNLDAEILRATAAETTLQNNIDTSNALTLSSANTYTDVREAAITAYIDTAITSITSTTTTIETDITNLETSLMAYSDQAEFDANAYTDTREIAITTAYGLYADQAQANAITIANAYTDTREIAITTAYELYADQVETDANAYTDSQIATLTSSTGASVASVESDLSDETAARISADTSLQTQIATESARIDSILSGANANLDSFAEIVTFINQVDTTNDTALGTEIVTRSNADTVLQQNIDAEETARILGDASTLTSANAYTDARETAITTAYKAYTDLVEVDAKAYTDAREVIIKQYADQAETDANAYTDARETAITAAYKAYTDLVEVDAKSYTDAREVIIKQYADQAETDANAYTDSQIATLTSSTGSTVASVEADLSTEIADRIAGDDALDIRLSAVENTYVSTTSVQSLHPTDALSIGGNIITLRKADNTTETIDISPYLDDTNLSRIVSGTMDGNGIATFTRDDASAFTVDMSVLLDDTNLSRIVSATWNTTNGVLTLTRNDTTNLTVDLDGRYAYSGHTHAYLPTTGGTLTGQLVVSNTDPQIKLEDTNSTSFWMHTDGGIFYVLADRDNNGAWEGPNPLILNSNNNSGYLFDQGIYTDAYHPVADTAAKWTTARTLTLSGDVTGSVSMDGSANVSITTVVGNDSHSHSNYLTSNNNDSASGVYDFTNTTEAVAPGTGAVRVTGGMSVGGNMFVGGDVTAYSDIRVKTNIEKIDNALDKVLQLNGYTYDRTDKPSIDSSRCVGVIAQEVLKVLPEAVKGNEEDFYSVAYGNMVALLIEGMKEQQSQIEALKAEIQQLKDK